MNILTIYSVILLVVFSIYLVKTIRTLKRNKSCLMTVLFVSFVIALCSILYMVAFVSANLSSMEIDNEVGYEPIMFIIPSVIMMIATLGIYMLSKCVPIIKSSLHSSDGDIESSHLDYRRGNQYH